MPTVFASDPASAFAMSSNLDQQRVQNYLQSIAANRNSQIQGWQAAQQIAAARQAAEQQQQNQILQLAQHAIAQRQSSDQFAQNFGLNQGQLAENVRHNKAIEETPNASKEKLDFTKSLLAAEDAQRASKAQNIADYLNEHDSLTRMLKQIPKTPEEQSAAMDKQLSDIPFNWRTITPFVNSTRTPQAEMAIKQKIAGNVPSEVNPQWEGAKSVSDFADVAKTALDRRIKSLEALLPKTEVERNNFVTFKNGRYESNFKANPLLGTAPAVSAPKVITPAIALDFLNSSGMDKDAARAAARAAGYSW